MIERHLLGDPEAFRLHFERNDLSSAEFRAGARAIAKQSGFGQAIAWATNLSDETGRSAALTAVGEDWLNYDSMAAGEAISALERGPARDVLIVTMVEHLRKRGADAEALEWTEELSNPAQSKR